MTTRIKESTKIITGKHQSPVKYFNYVHLIGKIADDPFHDRHPNEWPLEDRHKEKFIELFLKLLNLYCLDGLAVNCLGTHFHCVLAIPDDSQLPTLKETAERYEACYGRRMDPRTSRCHRLRKKLNDISSFMKDLQSQFTRWYNKSFDKPRRGSLWSPRYKGVILKGADAVVECMMYVELNSVRAGIVKDPGNYHYSSWGMKKREGVHPFHKSVCKHLGDLCHEDLRCQKDEATVMAYYTYRLTRILALDAGLCGERAIFIAVEMAEKERLMLQNNFWSYGVAVGPENEVLPFMAPRKRPKPPEDHKGLFSA